MSASLTQGIWALWHSHKNRPPPIACTQQLGPQSSHLEGEGTNGLWHAKECYLLLLFVATWAPVQTRPHLAGVRRDLIQWVWSLSSV